MAVTARALEASANPTLSKEEASVVRNRIKALVAKSTSRIPEGYVALAGSPAHTSAFIEAHRAIQMAANWEGSRDDLEVFMKEAEARIVKSLAEADALVAAFPAGSGSAFGHTSGMPVIDNQTGSTKCHRCGEPVAIFRHIDVVHDFVVHLKMDAGHDVLLFVMHRKCWDPGSQNSSKLVEVPREEWMLLFDAKTVLSS